MRERESKGNGVWEKGRVRERESKRKGEWEKAREREREREKERNIFYLSEYLSVSLDLTIILSLSEGLSLESKWQQVSKTVSILADPSNAIVWMVSTRPPISSFFALFIKHLEIFREDESLLKMPSLSCSVLFFGSLARLKYLSPFSFRSTGMEKNKIHKVLFFVVVVVDFC